MEDFHLDTGGLHFELDALPSPSASKTVVTVSLAGPAPADAGAGPEGAPGASCLVDRVDLYSFRSRLRFAQLVAGHFGREPDAVLGQLAVVVDAASRALAQSENPTPVELTPERKRRAGALLRRPDLLKRAASAMDALGFVGEPEAKRLAYLVVTSRLLDRPLSALVFAPSSSGKSELFEVLTRLLPPEHVEFLSRLTPQALFYAGPNALRHKVVVVDEHVGAKEAEYSLRTLLSRGSLTLRSSPKPGAGPVRPFTVYGPISLLSGTASETVNEENLSRCLELTLDDSARQTERVHKAQRAAWAGRERRGPDLEVWRDAQRLLESTEVVIPFAPRLRFPARTSHDRRGNQKLLGLVASHALLHQRQRQRDEHGRVIATPADYAAVHALVRAAVRTDPGALSPRAARAYSSLAAGRALTRRELAASQGWAYNTAKKALAELVREELAQVVSRGAPARYALVDRSLLNTTGALLEPCELEAPAAARKKAPKLKRPAARRKQPGAKSAPKAA